LSCWGNQLGQNRRKVDPATHTSAAVPPRLHPPLHEHPPPFLHHRSTTTIPPSYTRRPLLHHVHLQTYPPVCAPARCAACGKVHGMTGPPPVRVGAAALAHHCTARPRPPSPSELPLNARAGGQCGAGARRVSIRLMHRGCVRRTQATQNCALSLVGAQQGRFRLQEAVGEANWAAPAPALDFYEQGVGRVGVVRRPFTPSGHTPMQLTQVPRRRPLWRCGCHVGGALRTVALTCPRGVGRRARSC
jgi:hypothetical protein